ncbi:MAG: hypothetical protein HUJ70_02385 [Pseudobutyrivibrio sp.]|nr:hypothetical protein [Pseudobutyrivibrio sp.]
MNGTVRIPKYYEGRQLPPGYVEKDLDLLQNVKTNVDMKAFAKYIRTSQKDAMEVTWDEIKQFLINPSIDNVWYI